MNFFLFFETFNSFLENYWFFFIFFGGLNFILNTLTIEFLFLTHFFNKNQIKTSAYFYQYDFWTILNKKLYLNLFF